MPLTNRVLCFLCALVNYCLYSVVLYVWRCSPLLANVWLTLLVSPFAVGDETSYVCV